MQHVITKKYSNQNLHRFQGYTSDISRVNPDIINVFAAAAFRFGHSQIPDFFQLTDNDLNVRSSPILSTVSDVITKKTSYNVYKCLGFDFQLFRNPDLIYRSGVLGDSVSGKKFPEIKTIFFHPILQRFTLLK